MSPSYWYVLNAIKVQINFDFQILFVNNDMKLEPALFIKENSLYISTQVQYHLLVTITHLLNRTFRFVYQQKNKRIINSTSVS